MKEAIVERVRQRLGLWLFRRSLPVFLRGGDGISLDPLVNGHWDRVLVEFIRHASRNSYDGFLLDIGANIGLTTAQCGDSFREVFSFEPNPEIFPVLELNSKLMLRQCNRHAFNFGLGPEQRLTQLNLPSKNFGGAFVYDEHNAYTADLIASKHGSGNFDLTSYRQVPVRIEAVHTVLPPIFEKLRAQGLTRGVIKLDVEGYEKAILESLVPCLPRDFSMVIVFENWDDQFPIDALLAAFDRPVRASMMERTPAMRGALWKDLPGMLAAGGASFTLVPLRPGHCEGEIVLEF